MLSIQLLGPPHVALDQRPLNISRRKSRALLYYLAAHSVALSRDQILALLWPDHDRTAAQQLLRTTLYGLRKELGPELHVTDTTLALAPDTAIDLRRFERGLAALSEADDSIEPLAATLALYRGEFLAGFSLPDAEGFERWVAALRERTSQLAQHGYTILALRYEAHRDFSAAREVLARAIALNPLHEELQRTAMRIEYFAGDRAGAIRRYEQLRRLLDDELGVPPLEETRALYDAIITDTVPTSPQSRGAPYQAVLSSSRALAPTPPPMRQLSAETLPFTGRTAELHMLQALAVSHRLGLIEGETGIGKTRLAEAFLSNFAGIVLIGRAHELEQGLPYQPVIEALRELMRRADWPQIEAQLVLPTVWRSELARLLPELHAQAERAILDTITVPGGNEARLWEAVSQLLFVLARLQPVAFLIDDLHWADAATLALLGYLVRQPGRANLTFLATTRSIEPRSQLAALVRTLTREGRLLRLPLTRLGDTDTLTLAQHLSPLYAYPLAEWLTRNADGSPYIVAELVRYAREQGMLLADGTLNLSLLSTSPVVPGTVYTLLQARLDHLSDAARRVVDVAVAVGSEFDLDVIVRAAGLPEATVLDALDELLATQLIQPLEGLRYRFDHPLTMEVAYREVGEARHRAIHRMVAAALEQLHANQLERYAGLIASHFAEGNAAERAAHYAFLAGQRAAELSAWAEAIAFYQQALTSADDTRRLIIYQALGTAYMYAGAPAQAADELRTAVALAEQRNEGAIADRARLLLARTLMAQARFAEAIAIAQQILAHGIPDYQIDTELLWATALSIEGVDLEGAAQHLQHAIGAVATPPTPEQQAHIQFELGGLAAQQGDLPTAITHYRQTLAIAEANPEVVLYRVLALNNLAYHLMLLGDPTAQSYAVRGLELATEQGLLGFQPYLHSTLGEIALAEHDLNTAEQQFNQGLAIAEQLNIRERIAGITANLGLLAIQRGQPTRAIHRLATAQAQADALGTNHLAALIRMWLAPLLPPEEARVALAEARAIAQAGRRKRLLDEIAQIEARL